MKYLTLICIFFINIPAIAKLNIQTWLTENHTKVLFVHTKAVPMLDIQVDIKAGEAFSAPTQTGLANLTQMLIGKENTELDEQQLAEKFAEIGAQRSGATSMDKVSFSLRTLTQQPQQQKALNLFTSSLLNPKFSQEIFNREKRNFIAQINEANKQPDAIAEKTFQELIYKNHPYGRHATQETINKLQLSDIENFYQQHYQPQNMVISIVGAIDKETAITIANQISQKKLNHVTHTLTEIPPVSLPTVRTNKYIAHPATQAHILIGIPTIKRNDPNIFTFIVGNHILGGGGFESRLMNEVREKRGLAYSVYSNFSPALELGTFEIGLQTKKDQAAEALNLTEKILKDFIVNGPTDEELINAKSFLTKHFPLNIDSNQKILQYLSLIGFYDLPTSYLDNWTKQINNVTKSHIKDYFREHIKFDLLSTVIVGSTNNNMPQ